MANLTDKEEEDIFNDMVDGTFEETKESEETPEETPEDGEAENAEEELDDSEEHDEDTDLEEAEEEEEQPDDGLDGDDDEDSEAESDDEEEDTPVEDYDDDEESEEDEASEDEEDETDTDPEPDGVTEGNTDEVDYKAFYEAVTGTEFVVNGKRTKGFNDPSKIIQAQQMAGGFSEKMAGFKKYRPYMAPLQERGMLDDPEKFNLAMQLVDGDVEALKAHMKSLDVDPLELDMDEIGYSAANTLASEESLVLDDTLEVARNAGIEPQLREIIGKQWDQSSFDEFLKNPSVRADLIDHIQTGAYDMVQNKINEKKQLDVTGQYGNMTTIQQYRTAVRELQAEAARNPQPAVTPEQQAPVKPEPTVSVDKVKAEKAKIAKERKEAKYKAKAATESKKLNEQRKKATSVSKRKPAAKAKAKFDPMKVEGEDLDDLMNFLIEGGR